jgi:uncharacterized low-complexity protein
MKKIIIGLLGLLIVALVVIKVTNAQTSTQEVKKASTESKMDCGKCPAAKGSAMMADNKTAESKVCDPAKCKMMAGDTTKCKEGKCDTTKCKAGCKGMKTAMMKCDPSKCTGMNKK